MKTNRHNNHGDNRNRLSLKTRLSAMACTAAMATFSTIGSAAAATDIWSPSAGTATWSTAANWDGTAPVNGDNLVFSNSTTATIGNDIAAGLVVAGISFSPGASTYVISGNSINLSGGITNNSTALQTMSTPLVLQDNVTFTNSTNGTIALSGIISGNYGLTLSGGTHTLSGANTFAGGSTLTAGSLNINNAAALGSGTLTINQGATAVSSGLSITNSLVVNGLRTFNIGSGATFGNANTVISGSGTLTFYGSSGKILTVSAWNFGEFNGVVNFTQGSSSTAYINSWYIPKGLVNMSANMRQTGAGAQNLTLGALSGNSGISQQTANAPLTFNITGSTNATFTGTFPGNNTRLNKSGAGTQTLSGASTGWTTASASAVTITNGAISVSADNNLGSSAVGVTLTGGTLAISGAGFNNTHTITVAADGGTINNRSTGNLNFGNANTLVGSGPLSIIGGPVWLQQANTYSGAVGVSNNGLLELGVANAVASAATVTAGAGGTVALDATTANSVTLDGGTLSPNNGPQTLTGAVSISTNGGTVSLKNWWNAAPQNLTVSSVISGSGNLNVTAAAGAATLTLSGNNTGTGTTTLNTGVTLLNTGNSPAGALTVASGGNVTGTGSVGAATINNGGTITPGTVGTGVASLGVTDLVLNAGGNYNWLLQDASGAAGTGYSTIASTGALDLSGLNASTPFNINLWTISTQTAANGSAVNFDYMASGAWTLVNYSTLNGSFDPSLFAINVGSANGTSGFANATNGVFSVAINNNSLQLLYTASILPYDWTGGSGSLSSTSIANNSKLNFAGAGGDLSNDAVTALNGITFGSIGTTASGSYNFSGNGLTLGSAGIVNFSAYPQTVALPLSLGSSQTFSASGSDLAVTGTVDNAGNTLTVAGPSNTALSGVISGSGGLTVSSGTTLLSGGNSYTGATRVNGGTLSLTNGGTMGAASSAVTIAGGTVDLGGQTLANTSLTLNAGALNNGTADLAQVTLNNGSVGATLIGSSGLAKSGSGTVILNGDNNYTGGTTLNGGLLVMGSANALSTTGTISFNGGTLGYTAGNSADNSSRFSTADNQSYSVNDGGQSVVLATDLASAGSSFAKGGSGTVTLAGNNALSGGVTAGGGALAFAGTNNIGTGNVTLDGGAIQYTGTSNLVTWAETNYVLATNTLVTTNVDYTTNEIDNLDGTFTTNVVSTTNTVTNSVEVTNAVVTNHDSFTNAVAVTSKGGGLSIASNTNGIIWRINAANQITGNGALAVTGNNNDATLVVNANQTNFTGPVTVSGARLEQGGVLGSPSIAVSNGGELAVNITTTNAISLDGGTLSPNGGARTVSGRVALGAGGGTVSLKNWWNATAQNLTISGVISGNGILNVTGPGSLTLAGGTANTYSGGTVVNAGSTVVPGNGNSSFGSGPVTLNGGTMSINGIGMNTALVIPAGVTGTVYNGSAGNIPYNGFTSITGSGTLVYNTATNAQIYIDGNYANYNGTVVVNGANVNTLSSAFNGTNAALVINGAGLRFASGSSATASTTIQVGSLTGAGGIWTKYTGNNVSITAGHLGGNDLLSGILNINAGTFTKVGSGTMTLTGANGYTGLTTVNGGALSLGNGGTTGSVSGSISVAPAGTLTFNRSDSVSLYNQISGSGAVAQNGTGTTVLSSDNSGFNGTVKLNAGVLALGVANALSTNAGIAFNGGTLKFGPNNNNDYSANISKDDNQQFNIELNGANVTFANGLTSAGGSLNLSDASGVTYTTNLVPDATNLVVSTNSIDNGDGTFSTEIVTNAVVAYSTNVVVSTNKGVGGLTLAGNAGHTGNTALNNASLTLGNGGDAPSLAGNIANNGALAVNNANSSTLAGDISGTGDFSKSGSGTVVLSGNNTLAAVNLNGGAVALGSAGALGNSGVISFNGGAIRYGSANQTDYSARFSTADYQAYSVDNNSQNVTWGTALTGANNSLRKTGEGVLTLSGANTYGGATTLNGGGLNVTGSLGSGTVTTASGSSLNVAAGALVGGDVVASGTVGGAGSIGGSLTLNSGSTLNLSAGGDPAILTVSSLIVNGGSGYVWNLLPGTYDHLNVSGQATFNATAGSPFSITVSTNSLSAFNPQVNATYTIMNFGSASNLDLSAISASAPEALSANGSWDVAATGNTLSLVYTYAEQVYRVTADNGLVLQSTGGESFTGATSILNKTGEGEFILDQSNSYGGNSTIASGTLTAANGSSFGNSSAILLGTSANQGSNAAVTINTGGVTVTNKITVFGSGSNLIANSSSGGNVSFSGAVAANKNITVANQAGGNLTLSGVISGSGQVSFQPGDGVITLTGMNTYTGGSHLGAGTLALGNNNPLGVGNLSVSGSPVLSAVADLTAQNGVILADGSSLSLDSGSHLFNVSGPVSGNGAINVIGSGTVVLSGTNSHVGGTTVNSGTLALGTSSALGNGNLSVGSAVVDLSGNNASVAGLFATSGGTITSSAGIGTLSLNGAGNSVFNGVLAGNLALNLVAGNLQITGANTYSGGTTVNGGLLFLGTGSTLGNGPVALNGGSMNLGSQTVTVGNATLRGGSLTDGTLAATGFTVSGTPDINASLADASGTSASFTLANGTVTLGSAATYSGGTVINNGSLTLAGGDNTLATNGSVNLASGNLNAGGNSQIIAGLAGSGTVSNFSTLTLATPEGSANNSFSGSLNGGSLVVDGSGTSVLTGSGVLSGTATVNSGATLELNGAGNISTALTVNGSLILNGLTAPFTRALSGSGNLVVSGGTFTLNTANTLAGGTVIGAANVTPANNGVFGPGLLTLNNGARVNQNGVGITNSVYIPAGANVTLYNDNAAAANNKLGAVTGAGTLNFNVYVNNARQTYFDGNYSNFTGSVNVTGNRQVKSGVNYDSIMNFTTSINGANANWSFAGPNIRYFSGNAGSMNLGSLSGSGVFTTSGGALSFTVGALNTDTAFSGDLYTGGGSFTKVGTGSLTLSGANLAYTGATTVNGGSLSVTGGLVGNGNGGGISVATNAAYSITTATNQAFASLNGNGSFVKNGTGTVTVNGTGNNFGGTATVAAGSLVSARGLGANAAITVGTGANLTASGNNGTVIVNDGASLANGSTLNLTSLTFGGNAVATLLSGFGTPAINVTGSLTTASGTGTVTLNLANAVWDEGVNPLISFGSSSATLADFALGSSINLTERQTAQAPELVLTANGLGLMVYGETPVWTGAANNSWSTNGDNNWVLPVSGTQTAYLASDKVVFNDTAAGTVAIDANGVTPTRIVVSNNVNGYSFSGGSIGDNASVATVLTKSGSGTLVLANAANTYSGGTTVNGGALVLAGSTIGSTNSAVTLNQGVIDLGSQTATNGVVTQNGGILTNGTLSFSTFNYNDGALAVTLTGSGSLVKNGSGVLALNGTNNYSGGTVINGGAISFTDTINIGSGAVTLNGGALQYDGNSDLVTWTATNSTNVNVVTTTTNAVPVVDSNNVALVDSNNFPITTNVVTTVTNSVATNVVSTFQSFTNRVTVGANGGAITMANGNVLRLNAANQLTGSGALVLNGNTNGATLVLNANQSYSGNITVNGARLEQAGTVGSSTITVNDGGELAVGAASTSAITLNGGLLSANNAARTISGAITLGSAGGTLSPANWWNGANQNITLTGVISGSGALTVNSGGSVTLSSSNTYTGGTMLNAGSTVVLASANPVFGTGAVTLNGGAINFAGYDDMNLALVIPAGATGTLRNDKTGVTVNGAIGSLTGSGTLSVNPGSGNQFYIDGDYSNFNGTVLVGGTYINGLNSSINATNASFVLSNSGLSYRPVTGTVSSDLKVGSLTGSAGIWTKTNTDVLNVTAGYLGGNDLFSGNLNINAGTFTKVGSGTMTLAGDNYTGTTAVNGGTLLLGSREVLNTTTNVLDNGDGTFTTNVATVTNVVAATLTGTDGTVVVNDGTLDLGGQSAPIAGFSANGGTVRNGTLRASTYSVASGTIEAVLADGATASSFTKTGTGTATLSVAPTYTGTTTITGGGKLNASVQLPGDIAFTGAGKSSYLSFADLADTTITNSVTVSGGAVGNIQNSGSSTLTLAANMDNTGSALRFFGGSFNVTGNISNSSASNSSVSVVGSSVNLATAQSFGGTTAIIGGGSLVSGIDNALPTSTVLSLARSVDSVSATNTFDLAGHAQTLAGINSHLDDSNQLNQVINTSATKSALTLTGDSSYGGQIGANIDVAVNGGSLLLSGQNQLAEGNNLALNGGTLALADGSNVKVGSLTLTGASVIDFSGLGGQSSVGFNSLTITDTLSVYNWVDGVTQLFDHSNGAGFASVDLSKISFYSDMGTTLTTGEIVAVPEPGAVVAGLMLLAFLILGSRRTLIRVARRIA